MVRVLAVTLGLLASACSGGTPATTTGTLAPAASHAASAPATTAAATDSAPFPTSEPPAPTVEPTATTVAATPAPLGGTSFHLVVDEGPKAGTYDVTSIGPADCNYVTELDKWNATYLGPPPLSFISAGLAEDFSSLLITFDGDSPAAVYYRSLEDVTYDVEDTGTTATLNIVSDANEVDFEDELASENVGRIELTVECSAPFRYE